MPPPMAEVAWSRSLVPPASSVSPAATMSPAAMAAPAVSMVPAVVFSVVAMLVKAEVQENGRGDIGRVAVSGIIRISAVGGIGWRIDGAAAETTGQQQRCHDTLCCAHASSVHVSALPACNLFHSSRGLRFFNVNALGKKAGIKTRCALVERGGECAGL